MKTISLDCLTLPDVSPIELFGIAAEAGFTSASLWVQPPALFPTMLASPDMMADIGRAIADSGIAPGNLEVFNLNVAGPIEDYERTLAFGAQLGAKSATAINFGIARPDIAERLAAFHALCSRYGLKTYLEPISMGATRTLREGEDLITEAGVDAQLVVDCLHLARTGTLPDSISTIAPGHIGYVQICDGPAVIADDAIELEAVANRLYPGEGDFPLVNFLKAVPAHAPLGVEIPNRDRMDRGHSPLDRAREALQATNDLLIRLEAARKEH